MIFILLHNIDFIELLFEHNFQHFWFKILVTCFYDFNFILISNYEKPVGCTTGLRVQNIRYLLIGLSNKIKDLSAIIKF